MRRSIVAQGALRGRLAFTAVWWARDVKVDDTQGADMWVLVIAILVGVVVLATGMRSSLDEAWLDQADGDPADAGDVMGRPAGDLGASSAPIRRAERAA